MNEEEYIRRFRELIYNQIQRTEKIKQDLSAKKIPDEEQIIIGICGGDGIGPVITSAAEKVLKNLLKEEVSKGKVKFNSIEGLTIENRMKMQQAIPNDVLKRLKECSVILKGPTTTPRAGDGKINLESANVAMRRELDLFANMRPVRVPEEKIDWTFFRENTEGSYALGSQGIQINDDLAIDFTVTTKPGTVRLAELAFAYARKHHKKKVSIITKANVIKTTDGNFLRDCKAVAEKYPEIETDDWYIDIATAKLIDLKRRGDFSVFILPNLYGDIITDEAAEIQGGVGTAGSANIGTRYAMFEAIHGSAPRMVAEGRAQYADPTSTLRASVLLLEHIGYYHLALLLKNAIDICTTGENKCIVTGRKDGATTAAFADYILETVDKMRK